MEICCVSDLHGYFPDVGSGDLLIICGDLTARDDAKNWCEFFHWLRHQKYHKKIFIGGNHDNYLVSLPQTSNPVELGLPKSYPCDLEYLCDSGTEITYYPYLDPPDLNKIGVPYKRKTLKIWGSPWTKTFPGMNPHCKSFTCDTEEELAEKWALIPDNIEILITHSPPHGILDKTIDGKSVGSKSLALKIGSMINPPKLWVWGHIHEAYGQDKAIRR